MMPVLAHDRDEHPAVSEHVRDVVTTPGFLFPGRGSFRLPLVHCLHPILSQIRNSVIRDTWKR